jgi:hypothetical protein
VSLVIKNGCIIRADLWETFLQNPYVLSEGTIQLRKDLPFAPIKTLDNLPEGLRRIYDYVWENGVDSLICIRGENNQLIVARRKPYRYSYNQPSAYYSTDSFTALPNRKNTGKANGGNVRFGNAFHIYCGHYYVSVVIQDGCIVRADLWPRRIEKPYTISSGSIALRLETQPLITLLLTPGTQKITMYDWMKALPRGLSKRRFFGINVPADYILSERDALRSQ